MYDFKILGKVAKLQLFLYHKFMKTVLVLLAEISGLLIIFVLFLLVLSYFKIITFPNFLPQNTTSTTQPINPTAIQNINQNTIPVSFVKLANQAPDTQIQKYISYATKFSKPTAQANPNDYVSDAVFSGYDSKTIQVVTKEGVLNLSFDPNTLFQKQPDPKTVTNNATNSGALLKPIAYATAADFFKDVQLSNVIQIYFSKPNLKATQVNYIESIKPIL
jgi:hypothetical protein